MDALSPPDRRGDEPSDSDDDDSMSSPTFSEPSQLEVDEDLQFDEDKEQRRMEMMMQAASNRLQNKDDEELIQYSELKYISFRTTGPQVIKDVFDGELYRKLLKKRVIVDRHKQGHKFFSDDRDIALGICQDGFLIFQRNRKGPSATPILIQNYNLPPTVCTHAENLICVGVIPGPHQPKDTESFLLPLEEELAKLAVGVPTYDAESKSIFDMHAYQLFGLGDILAIEKTLRIKGHNSMCACRSCNLKGVRNLAENGKIYYIPLKLPHNRDNNGRDPRNLPKRTHSQFIETLSTMDSLPTKSAREKKAKATGIKDWPIFRRVNSLDYAKSFPWDWMHLLLENVIPNLLDLWMGRYKGLDMGTGDYEIPLSIWNKIAEESVNATEHIPAEFTRVIPHLITQRSTWTAESYCFWFCYLFPIVLRNRFPNDKYYKHGCLLVKIMKTCLQFSITEDELNTLDSDIVDWVEKYERYYYQYKETRLSTCVLTIHGLLHLADDIRWCGPGWTTWTFFMERFCGSLKAALRSKSHPWANLSNHCVHSAYLRQLGLRYDLARELEDAEPDYRRLDAQVLTRYEREYDGYPNHIVCHPVRKNSAMTQSQKDKITEYLHAVDREEHENESPMDPHRGNSEAKCILHSHKYELEYEHEDQLVDNLGYGELISVIALEIPAERNIFRELAGQTVLLAHVTPCKTGRKDARRELVSYSACYQSQIMDVRCVTAVVGRIKRGKKWYILDRFEDCAIAAFVPNDDEGEDGHESDDSDLN
ncbi:hypothetical protein MD484_g7253, partial [Candolleomyces efflorescens]